MRNTLFPILLGILCGQIEEYFCLHGVGILEFINQEIFVPIINMFDQVTLSRSIYFQRVTQVQKIIKE